jgi:hypothetical protein
LARIHQPVRKRLRTVTSLLFAPPTSTSTTRFPTGTCKQLILMDQVYQLGRTGRQRRV